MKAIRKPTEVDYHVWDGNYRALCEFVRENKDFVESHFYTVSGSMKPTEPAEDGKFKPGRDGFELYAYTDNASSTIVPLNYVIIRGATGSYYPCEPKLFEATYTKI